MVSGQFTEDDDMHDWIELSYIEFCCRRGTLLSARPTSTITNKSADVSSTDGHSNIHSDGGTTRNTIINGSTFISAIGCSNSCHANINANIDFASSGTNSSTINGTNRSTIGSAIGGSNNCHTNINAIIGFAISGTNSSTVSGTNGSTIISAIGSSNIHADN